MLPSSCTSRSPTKPSTPEPARPNATSGVFLPVPAIPPGRRRRLLRRNLSESVALASSSKRRASRRCLLSTAEYLFASSRAPSCDASQTARKPRRHAPSGWSGPSCFCIETVCGASDFCCSRSARLRTLRALAQSLVANLVAKCKRIVTTRCQNVTRRKENSEGGREEEGGGGREGGERDRAAAAWLGVARRKPVSTLFSSRRSQAQTPALRSLPTL